ncbi:MAG: RNA polymerase subunit sigma-24 [Hydrogenophilales bacterium 28-61-11]|nr:MAG: RNA polymerase subunit sigma-24 [Hydrogenophilales bacterium 28-61-11]OYZ56910.1 MAG: RNA polymerase subunit sigma-24 [Hydrogenophilales bacterium 16-61-112]OZA46073.1 MAG: RNA polymerase subunit sigma-24 [Hydrogenophilales bacterium 17-61-76]HQT29950.1 RNA polymerase sigma factor [Thiobacillus sp.]
MTMIHCILFGPARPAIESLRPVLYRIAYAWCHDAALADDLVQDSLSKAWTQRAQLREAAALKAWAVAIMHRCWMDHLRARRDFDNVDDWEDTLESADDTPEACYNREQVIACVRAAVAQLPMGQRQVLSLVDLEEFGYAEVARILDIPVGTVMSRLSRARASLKIIMDRVMQQAADRPALRRVK